MLIVEEVYPSIEIHQLVKELIVQSKTGISPLLGTFHFIDVNEKEKYDSIRIIGADHYNRYLLNRMHYETPLLSTLKKAGTTLVIYGEGAANVTATLYQRDFKAVLLKGGWILAYFERANTRNTQIFEEKEDFYITMFRKFYPQGLLSNSGNTMDVSKLEVTYQQLKETRWGKGRILHRARSSRSQSVDIEKRQQSAKQRPKSLRRPWR